MSAWSPLLDERGDGMQLSQGGSAGSKFGRLRVKYQVKGLIAGHGGRVLIIRPSFVREPRRHRARRHRAAARVPRRCCPVRCRAARPELCEPADATDQN